MLARLILFLILGIAAYTGVRWWRARKLIGSGGLNLIELNALMKLAKNSQRLDAALKMRVLIVEAAGEKERVEVAKRVDAVVRRLAQQEELNKKIREALAGIAIEDVKKKADDLRVDAETETDLAKRHDLEATLASFVTQVEQYEKLGDRQRDLHRAAERIMVELKNLHLAMLDSKSSAASLQSEPVKHALNELEGASETLRQETAAEEEVNRMLKVAASRLKH